MGADQFTVEAEGSNAQEAFGNAIEEAYYWHGHGGYSGTIAEKDSFVIIEDSGKDIRERIRGEVRQLVLLRKRLRNGSLSPAGAIEAYNKLGGGTMHWGKPTKSGMDRYLKQKLTYRRAALDRLKGKGRLKPHDVAIALLDSCDTRIDDKWGPAGCIDLTPKLTGKRKPKRFLFFGWASS